MKLIVAYNNCACILLVVSGAPKIKNQDTAAIVFAETGYFEQ